VFFTLLLSASKAVYPSRSDVEKMQRDPACPPCCVLPRIAVSAIELEMAPWLPPYVLPYVVPYVLLTCNALTILYVRPAALPSLLLRLLLLLMPPQLHPALHDMMMH
jgi:hypothetical protein